MKFNHSTLSIVAAASIAPTHLVDAHGYLKSPKSRNYYANTNGKWSGGTASDPAPENCPHCLNRGGTDGVCGISGNANYEQPPNAIGGLSESITRRRVQRSAPNYNESLTAPRYANTNSASSGTGLLFPGVRRRVRVGSR